MKFQKEINYNVKFWAGILLAQFVLFYIFSKIEIMVFFFDWMFEFKKIFHQSLFSNFSFSVGDAFYVLVALFLIYNIFQLITSKNRSKPLVKLLIFFNVFYFIYQIFWGMLYFQEPLIEKLETKDAKLEETKQLALKYLEKCKRTRSSVEEDEHGVFKIKNLKSVETEILSSQNEIPELFSNKYVTGINSFKPSLFGNAMSYTGILGYYNPFSAEAHYNPNLPNTHLPFTLAHESAHQLGFAREQEASFIAYFIGINSDNVDLKYSTELYVLKSLLNALVDKNEDFVEAVLDAYSDEMKRDRAFEKKFYEKHDGLGNVFFQVTNNLFLKSNQQEGSVTYIYFTDLLMRYEMNRP